MQYEDWGLPNNDLIKKAFEYSMAALPAWKEERRKEIEKYLQSQLAKVMQKFAQAESSMDSEDYRLALGVATGMVNGLSQLTLDELEDNDLQQIATARALIHGDVWSPHSVAAVFLTPYTGTVAEYQKLVEQGFPKETLDIATEFSPLMKLDLEDAERIVLMQKLSDPARRISLASHASSFRAMSRFIIKILDSMSDAVVAEAKKALDAEYGTQEEKQAELDELRDDFKKEMVPQMKAQVIQQNFQKILNKAAVLWNCDEGLQELFIKKFNAAAKRASAGVHLENSAENKPILVPNRKPGRPAKQMNFI